MSLNFRKHTRHETQRAALNALVTPKTVVDAPLRTHHRVSDECGELWTTVIQCILASPPKYLLILGGLERASLYGVRWRSRKKRLAEVEETKRSLRHEYVVIKLHCQVLLTYSNPNPGSHVRQLVIHPPLFPFPNAVLQFPNNLQLFLQSPDQLPKSLQHDLNSTPLVRLR